MHISKDHRKTILSTLFSEGVIVAHKNTNAEKHKYIADVSNLAVIKVCQSLTSQGHVTHQYNWNFHYYVLTDQGIEYLRGVLGLPEKVIPETLKVKAVPTPIAPQNDRRGPARRGPGGAEGGFRSSRFAGPERSSFRSAPRAPAAAPQQA
ncbi:30S ribosomal protein S10e [Fonticula alba]|uniref:30S ribosomal protein S10e n=1 Tax=Fonticula alba TaxID=691883 RepID=A0A058ZBP5_FONAL|nr:30S ribosomal protein S10e [Fonticula alba]KCV71343.1 30S ribosomal protein S10e [Fonticula alba]|eukprot:XP_009494466.1 30S ribosomal protein S10e [Fonticula alba]